MKTIKVLVLVAILLTTVLTPAVAGTYCDLAKWAGYHHPGLNLACFYEVITTLWESGVPLDQLWG